MRVAIVHDWLIIYAGAERVLQQILQIFPDANLFSVVDYLPENVRVHIKNKKATTTFIQNLPWAKSLYRSYFPLMPVAIEQLDLSKYDLIISSSSAVAKGILVHPEQRHICYCHSPMRYAWDMQGQYLEKKGRLKQFCIKLLLHKIRMWDVCSSYRVDFFISNSHFIANRIYKIYRRHAEVIYPPVDIVAFPLHTKKEDYYLVVSRLVSYKKVEVIVKAFSRLPQKKLIVIGEGPMRKEIESKAPSNVTFLGYQPDNVVRDYMQRAKAFIFAAKEDFGIVMAEAQSCGTPVIAFDRGGAREIVHGLSHPLPTGCFFSEQSAEAVVEAIDVFEKNIEKFDPEVCHENAKRFGVERFREEFKNFVERAYENSDFGGRERDEVMAALS